MARMTGAYRRNSLAVAVFTVIALSCAPGATSAQDIPPQAIGQDLTSPPAQDQTQKQPSDTSQTPASGADSIDAGKQPESGFIETGSVLFGKVCLHGTQMCTDDPRGIVKTADGWGVDFHPGDLSLESLSKTWGNDSASWNNDEGILYINIPVSETRLNVISRGISMSPQMDMPLSFGSGYSVGVGTDGNTTISLQPFFSANSIYGQTSATKNGDRLVHGLSYIEWDNPKHAIRAGIGDRVLRSIDPTGLGVVGRGISIERAVDLRPDVNYGAGKVWRGAVQEGGVIEIYSNGFLRDSIEVKPGFYQWENMSRGTEKLDIYLRNANGSNLLFQSFGFGYGNIGPGKTDFRAFLGQTPKGNPLADAFLAYGINSYITVSGQISKTDKHHNATLGVGISPNLPVFFKATAAKDDAGRTAWGATAALSWKALNADYSIQKIDRDFWSTGNEQEMSAGQSLLDKSARLSLSASLVNVSLWTQNRDFIDTAGIFKTEKINGIRSSAKVGKKATLSASFVKSTLHGNSVWASLNMPLSRKVWTGVNYSSQNGTSLNYSYRSDNSNRNNIIFTGNVYTDGQVNTSYKRMTSRGDIDVQASRGSNGYDGYVSWTGAVVKTPGHMYITRQNDTYVEVLAPNMPPDAKVNMNNLTEGSLKNGFISSYASGYSETRVSLLPQSLPLNVMSKDTKAQKLSPRKGVGRVMFEGKPQKETEFAVSIDDKPSGNAWLSSKSGKQFLVLSDSVVSFSEDDLIEMTVSPSVSVLKNGAPDPSIKCKVKIEKEAVVCVTDKPEL